MMYCHEGRKIRKFSEVGHFQDMEPSKAILNGQNKGPPLRRSCSQLGDCIPPYFGGIESLSLRACLPVSVGSRTGNGLDVELVTFLVLAVESVSRPELSCSLLLVQNDNLENKGSFKSDINLVTKDTFSFWQNV